MKKNLHAIGLLLFGLSTVGAIADDHGNTYGTATVIPLGQLTIDGRLDTTTDDDWFRFTVSQRSRVLIYSVNPTPSALTTDTFAYLYDAGGNYLSIADDNSGAGKNFQINEMLNEGTYNLRVFNFGRNVVGNYRLYLHTSDNAVDFPGPEMVGAINLLGENTFYRFSLTKRQRILLYTVNSTPSALTTDTFAYLYDAGGNYLSIADDNSGAGKNFQINEIMDAGTYYLRVFNYSQNATGGYLLRMSNQANAKRISPGFYNASLDYAGDNDLYEFTVPRSQSVTMESTGSTDTFAYLYDAGGNYLSIADDNNGAGNNFKIRQTLSAGTYYVRVLNYSQNQTGNYTLALTIGTNSGSGGSPDDTWTGWYQKADSDYSYYASMGDYNFAYAFYYYNRAMGDYLYYAALGRSAEANYWFHIWVGVYHYYYFQIIPGSTLPYFYLFQWYAYAYYYYFLYLGDINAANEQFNLYYTQALGYL